MGVYCAQVLQGHRDKFDHFDWYPSVRMLDRLITKSDNSDNLDRYPPCRSVCPVDRSNNLFHWRISDIQVQYAIVPHQRAHDRLYGLLTGIYLQLHAMPLDFQHLDTRETFQPWQQFSLHRRIPTPADWKSAVQVIPTPAGQETSAAAPPIGCFDILFQQQINGLAAQILALESRYRRVQDDLPIVDDNGPAADLFDIARVVRSQKHGC